MFHTSFAFPLFEMVCRTNGSDPWLASIDIRVQGALVFPHQNMSELRGFQSKFSRSETIMTCVQSQLSTIQIFAVEH